MKFLPSYKAEKIAVKRAIKNCKDFFGEEVCYDIEFLKTIKDKFEGFLEFLKKSDKTEIEKMVVSCGGTKNLVKVSAIKETKLYKETLLFVSNLKIIIQILEANNLTSTKGFDFTQKQIDKTINEIKYFK